MPEGRGSPRGTEVSTSSQHDEFERVLRSMRERLDTMTAAISDAITKANWHAENAPMSMRVSARTAAAEIAYTQEWLHERLRLLPFDPQQRHLVMQDLLQSQFVALQKITSIVEDLVTLRNRPAGVEYMPPGTHRPPQILPPGYQEPQFARDFPALGRHQAMDPPPYRQLAPPPGGAPFPHYSSPQQSAPLHIADLDPISITQRTRTQTQPMKAPSRTRRSKDSQNDNDSRELFSAANKRLAVRTAGLTLAVAAVVGMGYFGYARWWSKSPTARSVASKAERVSVGDPNARAKSGPGIVPPPVRSLDPSPNRIPSAPPMSAPPLEERSGPLPGLVIADPTGRPPVRTGNEPQFVAVIATHRDRAALLAIFNDLRRQFPTVMAQRRADAQAVNLGEKGVWHHLVLLPLGTRQQAASACEELRAVGYARCFVRPY